MVDHQSISAVIKEWKLWQWIVFAAFPSIATFCLYFWRYLKVQWRFGRNLKKTVYFLKTSDEKSLEVELATINNLGIFRVDEKVKDISGDLKICDTLKNKAVYIVGYNKNYHFFEGLIGDAKRARIPVIIFARPREIREEENLEIFNKYIYCDIANTTNRIAVILMAMLRIT